MSASCHTCKLSGMRPNDDGSLLLVCRAHPPWTNSNAVPQREGVAIMNQSLWPVVKEGDWCGEYQPQLDS